MTNVLRQELISEEEYFAMEESSPNKLEFKNGQIYSMADGSFAHGQITGNLNLAFKFHLKGSPCTSSQDTLKVKKNHSRDNEQFYYLPDVLVACGKHNPQTQFAQEVVLIVEVLSPSTRNRDLSEKFHDYQQIDTLQEYVVVEQDSMCVDIYRRQDNWEGTKYLQGSTVEFKSIELSLPIEDIYEDIEFDRKTREIRGLRVYR